MAKQKKTPPPTAKTTLPPQPTIETLAPVPDSGKVLEFWQGYHNMLQGEILTHQTEISRYLHYKLLAIGAFVAIAEANALLVVVLLLLPLVLLSVDLLHYTRSRFIRHRWLFLANTVVPRLAMLLGTTTSSFFPSEVKNNYETGTYISGHRRMRTLVMVPTVIMSSVAAGLAFFHAVPSAGTAPPHIVGMVWAALWLSASVVCDELYNWRWAVGALGLLLALLLIDTCFISGTSVHESIQDMFATTIAPTGTAAP